MRRVSTSRRGSAPPKVRRGSEQPLSKRGAEQASSATEAALLLTRKDTAAEASPPALPFMTRRGSAARAAPLLTMDRSARCLFNLTARTTGLTARAATLEDEGEEGERGEREEGESDEGSLSPPQSREGSLSPPRDRGLSCVDETRPRGVSLEPSPLSQPYVIARHNEIIKLQRKLGVTREEGGEEDGEVRLHHHTLHTLLPLHRPYISQEGSEEEEEEEEEEAEEEEGETGSAVADALLGYHRPSQVISKKSMHSPEYRRLLSSSPTLVNSLSTTKLSLDLVLGDSMRGFWKLDSPYDTQPLRSSLPPPWSIVGKINRWRRSASVRLRLRIEGEWGIDPALVAADVIKSEPISPISPGDIESERSDRSEELSCEQSRVARVSPLKLVTLPRDDTYISANRKAAALFKPHTRARTAHAAYPTRAIVPDAQVAWSVKWHRYAPPSVTVYSVLEADRSLVQGGWADPVSATDLSAKEWEERPSFEGPLDFDGAHRPRNPKGRTGLANRGAFGRWGPNYWAVPIVTRWHPEERTRLQMVAVRGAPDEGVDVWALPGGFVTSAGETVPAVLRRELSAATARIDSPEVRRGFESEVASLFHRGERVYQGYLDEERNTDHAWFEASAFHFACEAEVRPTSLAHSTHTTPDLSSRCRGTCPSSVARWPSGCSTWGATTPTTGALPCAGSTSTRRTIRTCTRRTARGCSRWLTRLSRPERSMQRRQTAAARRTSRRRLAGWRSRRGWKNRRRKRSS